MAADRRIVTETPETRRPVVAMIGYPARPDREGLTDKANRMEKREGNS
jgi:hypothetical protein